ncbi:MAG: replicative DNA helicase [Candidatus Omnitrophica bacterium]|nr:replicative DNA helicase [Candidatus Omnitrophota bacterium]
MNGTRLKNNLIERVPPQNLEAESAVLGSMLIEESAVSSAIELLKEEDFYKSSNGKIFLTICNLFSQNKAIDLIIVTEELKKRGLLDEVGGPAYLMSLSADVPTAANVEHYAKIVREKSVLRKLINTATQIITDGYEEKDGDVEVLLDRSEKAIFDITSRKIEPSFTPLKDIIKDSIETIDNLYQRKTHITGIATGFTKFDVMTAGLQVSDLIVVAGRPSMGKTSLALCMVENAAVKQGLPVAVFSLEMSKEQLVQRMLCSHARVNLQNVRTGYLSQQDWPNLTNAAGRLSEAPIYIDDTAGISVLELRAKARRLKSQFDIKLIMLDYLQLMDGKSRSDNRQQEISDISRALKSLARELRVPVIAVSQLSRAVESRIDRKPQLSDLRESGAIEQDADVVVLLLREEYYTPTEENKGKAEVNIAKQRNGPTGSMFLTFIKEFARFENYAQEEAML